MVHTGEAQGPDLGGALGMAFTAHLFQPVQNTTPEPAVAAADDAASPNTTAAAQTNHAFLLVAQRQVSFLREVLDRY